MAAKTPLAFPSSEVRLQWGEDFPIFIDRNDLKWGQEWKARIGQSLDGVTFLVPIVTPGYLKSDWCRKEFLRFVKREKELKRRDLILPVYYVRCPVLEDDEKHPLDELAKVLHERQYKDWRRFRHEPWTAPEVGRQFEQMAQEIVEALERGGLVQPVVFSQPFANPSQDAAASPRESPIGNKSAPKEPPTVVVDAMHRGDFASIAEAIKAAKAGTRILVRPGHYREALVIDKPLEIVGEGNRDDVVVETTGANIVRFTPSMGRVANLTLRQAGGGDFYAVSVEQGRLDLEDCDITSRGLAVVGIFGRAEPRVRRNRIHDGQDGGVYAYDNAAGLIEDNEIFGNALAGITIRTGNPTIRRNRIHSGHTGGVFVWEKAAPLIEDNDILSNSYSGCEVREGGNPVVRNNRIRGNREGIRVYNGGRGTFENNTLSANVAFGNWVIAPDCLPNIKRSNNIEE